MIEYVRDDDGYVSWGDRRGSPVWGARIFYGTFSWFYLIMINSVSNALILLIPHLFNIPFSTLRFERLKA